MEAGSLPNRKTGFIAFLKQLKASIAVLTVLLSVTGFAEAVYRKHYVIKLLRKMPLIDLAKIVSLQHRLPSVLAHNLKDPLLGMVHDLIIRWMKKQGKRYKYFL